MGKPGEFLLYCGAFDIISTPLNTTSIYALNNCNCVQELKSDQRGDIIDGDDNPVYHNGTWEVYVDDEDKVQLGRLHEKTTRHVPKTSMELHSIDEWRDATNAKKCLVIRNSWDVERALKMFSLPTMFKDYPDSCVFTEPAMNEAIRRNDGKEFKTMFEFFNMPFNLRNPLRGVKPTTESF